jgi:predicted phosphodiesterase
MHPESNADAMLMDVTRQLLAGEKRIDWGTFVEPNERKWAELVDVMGWKFFLFHADQIRGHAGFPWYGFGKKINGWYMDQGPFDYTLAGHFHQRVVFPIGHVMHYNGGSPESHNTWAQEQLATMSTPNQLLLFVNEENGVTSEYQVHLTTGYTRRRARDISGL